MHISSPSSTTINTIDQYYNLPSHDMDQWSEHIQKPHERISPNCSTCGNQPERTKHLFYDSALATNMWMAIISDFNEQITEDDPTSQTMILFNQSSQSLTDSENSDLADIIMTIKHCLYRYKFQDNLQRIHLSGNHCCSQLWIFIRWY